MIQFTTDGVEVTASPAQLREARNEFRTRKLLHLPGLLSPDMADLVRTGIEKDGFEDPEPERATATTAFRGAYQGAKVGQDLRAGATARVIEDRTNDPQLLQFVQTIAGSPPLSRCVGRIFRLSPMAEDLPWHTDAEGGRLADLIIDLSVVRHEGGRFEMRVARTHEVVNTVDVMGFGDGLLIRISPDLEHHYKAIAGSTHKVTFSGWFVPEP